LSQQSANLNIILTLRRKNISFLYLLRLFLPRIDIINNLRQIKSLAQSKARQISINNKYHFYSNPTLEMV